jgi:hypothetical protein
MEFFSIHLNQKSESNIEMGLAQYPLKELMKTLSKSFDEILFRKLSPKIEC